MDREVSAGAEHMVQRVSRSAFLARNPFPHPYTIGFFFREKMRAIHHIAPDTCAGTVLEIGGGRAGLAQLLYPGASVVSVDVDEALSREAARIFSRTHFVCADATRLPFPDASFATVTMFDVLEHIPDDTAAMREAWRVLRPGGALLLTTPHDTWRFPHVRMLQRWAPAEAELFREWGHVRRGYSLPALEEVTGRRCDDWATFRSPGTSLAHDLAWTRLPETVKRFCISLTAPLTWSAYALWRPQAPGLELAVRWRRDGGA